MRVSQAKELFRQLTKRYFADATVTFTRQSRVAKPKIPLITLTPGAVRRPAHPVYKVINGIEVAHYESRLSFQVDLFTHGSPVMDEGEEVAREDTSMDDMLAFVDYLNSRSTIEWCHEHDVSVGIDGDVQDLTGVVNDNNYEFRSRLSVLFYFTQQAVGAAAVLTEDSLLYPHEEESESGEPVIVYTPDVPPETESVTGQPTGKDADVSDESVIVEPKFEPTPTGGGTQELADETTGYFTEAEIKEEENGNEQKL